MCRSAIWLAMVCVRATWCLVGRSDAAGAALQGHIAGQSGRSALEFLWGIRRPCPPSGHFLGVTRRMHPDVCEFISAAMYEAACTRVRALISTADRRRGRRRRP